jgi:hypothetical protein
VVHTAPRWNAIEDPRLSSDAAEASVAALLELVEEAAPEVAAHMDRTARVARMFALELGLSGALLELAVRTARVHDVGKLAIPPWVIEKPGPLSQSERAGECPPGHGPPEAAVPLGFLANVGGSTHRARQACCTRKAEITIAS